MRLSVILLAAGSSRRAGCDKLYISLGQKPALVMALEAFLNYEHTREVIVVSRADRVEANRELLAPYLGKIPVKFVPGGETRTDSVRCGLLATGEDMELCAIHDAARPFVTQKIIRETTEAAFLHGAAAPALPLKDTTLHAIDGFADGSIQRDAHFLVQTPQTFRRKKILEAYAKSDKVYTDDTSLWIAMGGKVVLTQGDENNYKLTTPYDMERNRSMNIRIGHGYDAHRFAPGRKLMLCGVEVPGDLGLAGVSDADVALHALMDALLGAAGLRDIGWHFPPSDPKYLGIDSLVLLNETLEKLAEVGATPTSADVTIVAQAPKLSPYIDAMRQKLTAILGCPVNGKATTEEGMGFTGRKEGIAAHAVALVNMKEGL